MSTGAGLFFHQPLCSTCFFWEMSYVPNLARFFIQGGGEVPAEVQSELYDIRFLCANHAAFAALRQDGQVPSETSGKYVAFDGWVLL